MNTNVEMRGRVLEPRDHGVGVQRELNLTLPLTLTLNSCEHRSPQGEIAALPNERCGAFAVESAVWFRPGRAVRFRHGRAPRRDEGCSGLHGSERVPCMRILVMYFGVHASLKGKIQLSRRPGEGRRILVVLELWNPRRDECVIDERLPIVPVEESVVHDVLSAMAEVAEAVGQVDLQGGGRGGGRGGAREGG